MKEHPYIRLGQTLARVPFFKDIDDAGIDAILVKSVILECDPGDVIIGEGAAGRDFFVLLKGRLRVLQSGREVALLDRPGEIVGEYALATGQPRSATVEAADRSFVLKVAANFSERLSEKQQAVYTSELYRFLVEIQAERLAKMERVLDEKNGAG